MMGTGGVEASESNKDPVTVSYISTSGGIIFDLVVISFILSLWTKISCKLKSKSSPP